MSLKLFLERRFDPHTYQMMPHVWKVDVELYNRNQQEPAVNPERASDVDRKVIMQWILSLPSLYELRGYPEAWLADIQSACTFIITFQELTAKVVTQENAKIDAIHYLLDQICNERCGSEKIEDGFIDKIYSCLSQNIVGW